MTQPNRYALGTAVRCAIVFKDPDAVAADPTGVTFWYRKPTSPTLTELVYGTDAEVVKDSTGNYHVDVTVDVSGTWYYGFIGTGAIVFADEGRFEGLWSARSPQP